MPISSQLAARMRANREAFDEARQEREDLVVEAFKKGGGMREIGELIGMSHVGVAKMLERLGLRARETQEEWLRRTGGRGP